TLRHHAALGFREMTFGAGAPFPDPGDALRALESALQGCTRCKLSKSRSTVVFGSGSPRARLLVVGEGPGEEEDRQGNALVGPAGQRPTHMRAAVGFEPARD